jgi:hypothetical protein
MDTLSIGWRFAFVSLAAWRVTHLLAEEDGPGDVIVRMRARLGDSVVGRAMDCFFCLSLWIAAPFAVVVARDVLTWILMWLAISGVVCLIQRATEPRRSTEFQMGKEGEFDVLLRSQTSGVTNVDIPHRPSAASADTPETDAADLRRWIGTRR